MEKEKEKYPGGKAAVIKQGEGPERFEHNLTPKRGGGGERGGR